MAPMTDRQHLVSSIYIALGKCWRLFRTLAQTHNTDEAQRQAATVIADQIERSMEVRQKPPARGHSIPPRGGS